MSTPTLLITDPKEVAKELFNLFKKEGLVEGSKVPQNEDKLITKSEAMEMLSIKSKTTLDKIIKKNQLDIFGHGKGLRLHKFQIEKLIQIKS